MNNIEKRISEVLAETLDDAGRSPIQVDVKDDLLEGGILDSVGYLDFIGALEDRFDLLIDISDLDEALMVSVAGLAKEIARLQAE